MKKLLTLSALIGSLVVSSAASALIVRPWTYFECTATDGKKVMLNDASGRFSLSYGDPSESANRITVPHPQVNYQEYTQDGTAFFSIGATDGKKTYTIFQSQAEEYTVHTYPTIKAGITITQGNDSQTLECKPSKDFADTKFILSDIFQNLDYFKNGDYFKQKPTGKQRYT